jgi:hypothetical protein
LSNGKKRIKNNVLNHNKVKKRKRFIQFDSIQFNCSQEFVCPTFARIYFVILFFLINAVIFGFLKEFFNKILFFILYSFRLAPNEIVNLHLNADEWWINKATYSNRQKKTNKQPQTFLFRKICYSLFTNRNTVSYFKQVEQS